MKNIRFLYCISGDASKYSRVETIKATSVALMKSDYKGKLTIQHWVLPDQV